MAFLGGLARAFNPRAVAPAPRGNIIPNQPLQGLGVAPSVNPNIPPPVNPQIPPPNPQAFQGFRQMPQLQGLGIPNQGMTRPSVMPQPVPHLGVAPGIPPSAPMGGTPPPQQPLPNPAMNPALRQQMMQAKKTGSAKASSFR